MPANRPKPTDYYEDPLRLAETIKDILVADVEADHPYDRAGLDLYVGEAKLCAQGLCALAVAEDVAGWMQEVKEAGEAVVAAWRATQGNPSAANDAELTARINLAATLPDCMTRLELALAPGVTKQEVSDAIDEGNRGSGASD